MTYYAFKLKGEQILAAEFTDPAARKKWEQVGCLYRNEGKSTDSNRTRKGWSWCIGEDADPSRPVFKSKADAKDDAFEKIGAQLAGGHTPEEPILDEGPADGGNKYTDENGDQRKPGYPGRVLSQEEHVERGNIPDPREKVRAALEEWSQREYPDDRLAVKIATEAGLFVYDNY